MYAAWSSGGGFASDNDASQGIIQNPRALNPREPLNSIGSSPAAIATFIHAAGYTWVVFVEPKAEQDMGAQVSKQLQVEHS